jgi:Ca2+-binding RTX toxin-like protein
MPQSNPAAEELNKAATAAAADIVPFWPPPFIDQTIGVDFSGTEVADDLRGTSYPDRIDGLGGDDVIRGLEEADTLFGRAGDDRLFGGAGEDWIEGGAGRDTIHGDSGDDYLYGGDAENLAGDDGGNWIFAGAGNDNVTVGPGNDYVSGGTGVDGVSAGAGDDTLILGDDRDVGIGEAGNDLIDAGAGNDLLDGGLGDDRLYARTGDDVADGAAGADVVDLGDGNDIGRGGAGDDTVRGRGGTDWISGGDGSDRLSGGAAGDVVLGGLGNDRLGGDEGDDYLYGQAGDDRLEGGAGNDWLFGDFVTPIGLERAVPLQSSLPFGTDGIEQGNNILASSSFSGTPALLDLRTNTVTALDDPETDPSTSRTFGLDVAVSSDDQILVGTEYFESEFSERPLGRAYLYDSDGTLLRTFFSPDENDPLFGGNVEIADGYAFIGSRYAEDGARPAVHMFDLATGDLVRSFRSPELVQGEWFGSEIAVSGDTVVISSPGINADLAPIYVFDRDTGDLRYSLDAREGNLGQFGLPRFGVDDVDIDGDRILVTSDAESSDVGYLFDAPTGEFIPIEISPSFAPFSPTQIDFELQNGQITAYGPIEAPTVDISFFVFDAETAQQTAVIENQGENALGRVIRPDGSILAVGSSGGFGEPGDTLYVYRPISEIAGGSNVLAGQEGNDTLVSGFGADRMLGGAGGDTFLFQPDWGTDVVTDFTAEDHLVFQNVGSLQDISVSVRDGSLVLGHQESELVLLGIDTIPQSLEFV